MNSLPRGAPFFWCSTFTIPISSQHGVCSAGISRMSLRAQATPEQTESHVGTTDVGHPCQAVLETGGLDNQQHLTSTSNVSLTVMSSVGVRGCKPFRTDQQQDRVGTNKLLNRDGKSWMKRLCTQGTQTEAPEYGTNSESRKSPPDTELHSVLISNPIT